VPSSLQYPLDRYRILQRKWGRLLDELSPEALSSPCSRSPRINPPPQSVWLSAIGQGLKLQYEDAFAAPIPSELAALVEQFEINPPQVKGLAGSADHAAARRARGA
jgi:hypothetical protein